MKRKLALCLVVVMLLSLVGCGMDDGKEFIQEEHLQEEIDNQVKEDAQATSEESEPVEEVVTIPGKNATDVVSEIRVGWNAGNDMECCDDRMFNEVTQTGKEKVQYYETCWGSAVLTEKIVDSVKNAGFNAIRIPITYKNHINANGIVDADWLERIKEIVDWAINRDMYCIINMHHDTGASGWLKAEESNYEQYASSFQFIWIQVADYFDQYDEHLIFEGFNELINEEGQWEQADDEAYEIANRYNQLFVDTIRSSNGFNKYRCLIVNTYAANSSKTTIDAFVTPKDKLEDRLIVSVHNYEGAKWFCTAIDRLDEKFVSKGIPVIIGEMGMTRQDGRDEYVKETFSYATKKGIKCFWWDDMTKATTAEDVYNYAIINRETGVWVFPELVQLILDSTD